MTRSPCDACLRRTFIVDRLAPFVELARHGDRPLRDILALADEDLIAGVAGRRAGEIEAALDAFVPAASRAAAARYDLTLVCRHDPRYPARLRDDHAAPAVLHLLGDHARLDVLVGGSAPAVAIVGTRRASPEGLDIARELGRGLAATGITVVSGMALGIDSAAHAGALEAGGPTIAVLAGSAHAPYPSSKAKLHARIAATGLVVSELPPGAPTFKWSFPARNRIIAGFAQTTVVVQAAERSGSLITAEMALELGHDVAAIPGSVREWRSAGTNALIRDGATLVREPRDILDLVLGVGAHDALERAKATPLPPPPGLDPEVAALLSEIEGGLATTDELVERGGSPSRTLAGLAELELLGLVKRLPGGRYRRELALG